MNIITSKIIISLLTLFMTTPSQAAPTAANFTHAEICKGTSFQGSLTGLVSGGLPPYNSYTITTAVSQGTLSLTAATGQFTYTAIAAPTNTAPFFRWDVKDALNTTSNVATYTIKVGNTVSAQTVRGCAGATITGTLSATAGTGPYTFAIVTNPTKGAVNLTGANNATFIYVPNSPPAFTSDSFVFNAIDAAGCASNANATVTIQSGSFTGNFTVNTSNVICAGSSISSTLSGHNTQGVAPFTYAIVTPPSQGTLTLASGFTGNGNFTYTSNSPFSGLNDTFTYTITDSNGCISNTATVTILVGLAFCNGLNCSNPRTFKNEIIACPGVATIGTISSVDIGGISGGTPPYVYNLLTTPAQGTLLLDANFTYNGNFTYTANSPFLGTTDTFTYVAHDAAGCLSNNIGQQIITVGIIPAVLIFSGICNGSSFTGTLFQAVAGGIAPYKYSIATNPLQGTLTLDTNFINNGIFTYNPASDFEGTTDSFTYQITDNTGCMSNPATVTLMFNGFKTQTNSTAPTCPGNMLSGNLSPLFSGGLRPYTFTQVTNPNQGTLSLSGNGNFTYLPNANFKGSQDSFQFTITDSTGCVSPIQTFIIPLALAVADNVTQTICPNITLMGNLGTSTIINLDGVPPYSFASVTNPAQGSLNINASTGTFTYTANATFNGTFDSFTYQMSDSTGCVSNIATVQIPVGLAPLANPLASTVCQNSVLAGTLTSQGVGGIAPYSFNLVRGTDNGSLTLANNFATSGNYTYIPNNPLTSMTDSFDFNITDVDGCKSNNATATILTLASPNATMAPAQTVCQNTTTISSLVGLVTGGTSPYMYTIINHPAHGALTLFDDFATSGSYIYVSSETYSGPDCFSFQVTDANGCVSNIGTVNFLISIAPHANDKKTCNICQGVTLSGSVTNAVTGGSGPYLYALVTNPNHALSFSFTANGLYTYTPNPSFTGSSDSFTFEAIGSNGCISDIATVTIPLGLQFDAINLVAPCPYSMVTSSLSPFITKGTAPFVYTLVDNVSFGSLSLNSSDGSFVYTASNPDIHPEDSFTFFVTDANGCVSNTITVTIFLCFS